MIEYDSNNIFLKIISNEIPSLKVYEDTNTIVIMDAYPEMPGHMLVIPKKKSRNIMDIGLEDLSKLILIVKKITESQIYVFGAAGCKIKQNNNTSTSNHATHVPVTNTHTNIRRMKSSNLGYEINIYPKQLKFCNMD